MAFDFHTHVFPPELIAARRRLVEADATFAALYASPLARLATADELQASMARSAINAAVILGFAWSDPAVCREHNDYLLEASRRSDGRLVAFCGLPLAEGRRALEAEAHRCMEGGARGFGELRPENLGFDLAGEDGASLGRLARETGALLLFHTSEPVGHDYPGKRGLAIEALYAFLVREPEVRVVASHWGGGLPFYALMPEVKAALANVYFDTAATSLLYSPGIYRSVADLVGADRVLFGSDFPLLSQARSRRRLQESGLSPPEIELALAGNAARLLGAGERQAAASASA